MFYLNHSMKKLKRIDKILGSKRKKHKNVVTIVQEPLPILS